MNIEEKLNQAKTDKKVNADLVKQLKRKKPKNLDEIVHSLHDETFEEINCLTCGNCCKTTSPAIHERDLDRMARFLRVKPSDLIDRYLHLDSDGDYVFHAAPCPFLGPDNYCSIYDARPQACREYPHTNRKKFYQLLDLSLKNTEICPAVARIFDELRNKSS